jgi:hypothetical protein
MNLTTSLAFPLTAVELYETAAGTGLSLEPHATSISTNQISGLDVLARILRASLVDHGFGAFDVG